MLAKKPGWRSQLPPLRKAQVGGRFAEFIRKPKDLFSVSGYLIELSKDCLVIKEFNWDTFSWNGTCIIQSRDVAAIAVFDDTAWPIMAATRLQLLSKIRIKVTARPFHAVVRHYLQEGDIVQIEQEKSHPGELFLCEICKLGQTAVEAKSYDRSLESFEELDMLYREITKVTFGDAYSAAAKVALRRKDPGDAHLSVRIPGQTHEQRC